MKNPVKVLIADGSPKTVMTWAEQFKHAGFYTITLNNKSDELLKCVSSARPEIIILTADIESCRIIRSLRSISGYTPLIIAVIDGLPSTAERELIRAGANQCIVRPSSSSELVTFTLSLMLSENMFEAAETNIEKSNTESEATDFIRHACIPAHVKGYQYLRAAIILSVNDPDIINNMTGRLYPSVARLFNTTASRVERAIRHAISIAWERGDPDALNDLFGYSSGAYHGKPTNSEFIAFAADKIRIVQGKGILDKDLEKI